VQSQWMGKCPDCGVWDSLERFIEPKAAKEAHAGLADSWTTEVKEGGGASLKNASRKKTISGDRTSLGAAVGASGGAIPLPEVETSDVQRIATGIAEFDRVLGGGLVPGSVTLLGGDPGIGKSTLLLQAGGILARHEHRVLYVSSEESAYQTRLRADRLFPEEDGHAQKTPLDDLSDLHVLADTNLNRIVEQARQVQPSVMIVDSIQMIYKADLEAAPGTIAQVRRCCMELVWLAKISGMAILLVGHITKDGQLAGPKLLEHLVDVVLSFEGDRHHAHRVVRGIKNRFGTTMEVGLFEMTGRGLEEITNLSAVSNDTPLPGVAVCPTMHGSRCLLAEIQALTAVGFLGNAKRKTAGLDPSRLAMLIAVLEKHGGLRLADQDIFTSTIGGLKVIEPATDLALALAIAGAHLGRRVPQGTAVIGEVGLGGEIRPVPQLEPRLREAVRLGFKKVILSSKGAEKTPHLAQLLPVHEIGEALGLLT